MIYRSTIPSGLYKSLRDRGVPPFNIRDEIERIGKDGWSSLVSAVGEIITFVVIDNALTSIFGWRWRPRDSDATIWIIHPDGSTSRPFPLYQGLRVARKHGWLITDASQLEPKRVIGRREALSILLFGDR